MKVKLLRLFIILFCAVCMCACGSERKAQKDIDGSSNHNEGPKATAETPDIIEESSDSTVETSDSKEEPVDHFPDINIDTIYYSPIVVDQTDYRDIYSLLKVSDLIVKGKVIGHEYVETALETGIPINEKVDDQVEYYTKAVYEIKVEEVYKGTATDTIFLNMFGVQMNGEKEEQVRVIKEAAELKGNDENIEKYLMAPEAWNDFIITDGTEYLFCLMRHPVSGWDTINFGQGIYRLDDPTIKDHWGFLSAEEILKVFE